MKKAILKFSFFLFITVFISSCASFHSGNMLSSTALNSANFTYVKQNIYGEATVTYFLGIGGLGKTALVASAKKQMLTNFPLNSNQALANVTVNFASSYFIVLLFRTVKCTVTADVVEFK